LGTFCYGYPGVEVNFEDRALTHLQVVITAKLRRRESFVFSWTDSPGNGSGRSSVWLDPSIPLYYRYAGSRAPAMNRAWIDELMRSANSGGGLIFTNEPDPAAPTPKVSA